MKITFISNYYNHHQSELTKYLFEKCDDFHFISTTKMRKEREKMGYNRIEIPEYVKDCQGKDIEEIERIIEDRDVVMIGSADHQCVRKRIQFNRLTFKYSERPLRKENHWIWYLPRFIKWHMKYPDRKQIYLLCASAYTAYDYSKYFLFHKKAYKWGYFPETKYYDITKLESSKHREELLWCGRLLDWKHPDDAIKVAEQLKSHGYLFSLRMIGTGPLEEKVKRMIEEKGLQGVVIFEGAKSPQEVRTYMEQAGIYLFTSDYREGWGAVLNESMNSGCAVVASHAIGSVPYLLKNNENGIIYESGNVQRLFEKVKYLLDHPKEQERLGRKAYQTITGVWNAKVAAERFLHLAEHILNGEKSPELYEDGPCSKAEIIKDHWFYE